MAVRVSFSYAEMVPLRILGVEMNVLFVRVELVVREFPIARHPSPVALTEAQMFSPSRALQLQSLPPVSLAVALFSVLIVLARHFPHLNEGSLVPIPFSNLVLISLTAPEQIETPHHLHNLDTIKITG